MELPDSGDPIAGQNRQGKFFREGAGAGHRPATPAVLRCRDRSGIAWFETVNAVAVEIPLPSHKLIDREIVALARLVDRKPATAHGLD
jgi:hypothetical protein